MTPASTRHSWGEPVRFPRKTERECRRCGLVRVTRHEADGPRDVCWTEWWRDGDQIKSERTPLCDARQEQAREAA